MQYTDIHGHYAWGIDDGIETKEDATEALDKGNFIAIEDTRYLRSVLF